MNDYDSSTTLAGQHGRDNGKNFQIREVPPVEMATFILRLLGAIRLEGVDELRALMHSGKARKAAQETGDDAAGVADGEVENEDNEDDIDTVLRLLAGCDAIATRSLILDVLKYVMVAPDPQHPGMFRALRDDDIKELRTLGDIIGAFVRTHVMPGL